MTEEQILKLIQEGIQQALRSGSVSSQFSSLYPYFVIGLLSYMLGRINALHQDLKSYFETVKGFLASIDSHLRGELK